MKYLVLLTLPLMMSITDFEACIDTNMPIEYLDLVKKAMVQHESGTQHWRKRNGKWIVKLSKKKAIGEWQLMPFMAGEFNRLTGSSITVKDLRKRKINRMVGEWRFWYLISYFEGDYYKAVNAYNMGIRNTERGKYNFVFMRCIIPQEYKWWRKQVRIVKKSSEECFYVERD